MAAVEGRVVGAERVVSVKRVTTWSHHHSRCHAHLHALDSRTARAARPPATWTTAAPAARSLIVPSELGLIRSPSRPRLSGTREHTAPSAPLGARTRTQRRRTTRLLREGRSPTLSDGPRASSPPAHARAAASRPPGGLPAPREVVLVCVSVCLRGGGEEAERETSARGGRGEGRPAATLGGEAEAAEGGPARGPRAATSDSGASGTAVAEGSACGPEGGTRVTAVSEECVRRCPRMSTH